MAWETRTRQRYYYRKRREGDRVVSEYVGSGPHADLAADVDALHRRLHRAKDDQWAARRVLDARVDEICDLIHVLADGMLLAANYRTHKGQWRKKRYV